MTAEVLQPTRRLVERVRTVPTLPVVLGLLAIGRLLEFRQGGSPDEGGFLVVANQWHAGGTSLYGNYWVDRPPLLLVIYRIADLLGGLGALRVIGMVAAVATAALVADTARVAFGRRAANWSVVVAAALLLSPLYGAVDVNGELLAAPFIALGIRAAVEVFHTDEQLRSRLAALFTGAAAVAALLIKQNMADVVIFAAICWIVAWRTHRLKGRDLVDSILFAGAGFVAGYAVVMLWALAHGSSPGDIYQATYPFRITAAHVIAQGSAHASGIRLEKLVDAFTWSFVPLLLVAFALFGIRRSRQPAIVAALAVVLVFDAASVFAGGSYWLHYLIQSAPAVALAAGATSLAAPRVIRAATALVAASAIIATGSVVAHPTATPGTTVGDAVRSVAQPGDTLVLAFGDADILRNSGLTSPYPYLWSIPSRGLDPDLTLLRGLLAGPSAPTWIVVHGDSFKQRLHTTGTAALIIQRYKLVSRICGRSIYLLDTVHRAVPTQDRTCTGGTLLPNLP
ncbi:ArnT family glycosyltransferase [Nocardioides marmorisolisilvae]|uniref:ArnT family glycosyltransferase n=1 Tax=Nocardioides marmorisolisilvae TaxID=1542737 RepID=UPI001607C102|nr:glycosyltransferase family 39 protein [Nocardioides marmorisolisilvae]